MGVDNEAPLMDLVYESKAQSIPIQFCSEKYYQLSLNKKEGSGYKIVPLSVLTYLVSLSVQVGRLAKPFNPNS